MLEANLRRTASADDSGAPGTVPDPVRRGSLVAASGRWPLQLPMLPGCFTAG